MSKHAVIYIKNDVDVVIFGLDDGMAEYLVGRYAKHVDGYFFNPKYKLGIWDGKVKFFTMEGKTSYNLLPDIIPVLIGVGYTVETKDYRTSTVYEPEGPTADIFAHVNNPKDNTPFGVRPYQLASIEAILENSGNGIIIAGTGAGKTMISAVLSKLYGDKGARVIVIVPNISLVTQSYKFYRLLGLDFGIYGDSKEELDHTHLVTTWQSLKNRPTLMSGDNGRPAFNVVIVDECQGAKASKMKELLGTYGSDIAHRIGLTGTLPKSECDALAIRTVLGDVQFTVPADELIRDGFLSTLQIDVTVMQDREYYLGHDIELQKIDSLSYTNEQAFLQKNVHRNEWLSQRILETREKEKGNTLVLVTSVAYGKRLTKLVPGAVFIHGKDEDETRQKVYALFGTRNDVTVIATVHVAGVGLSIDRIFHLILVDLGKSFVRVIQAIGRGLRTSDDKKHVDVVDVCSNLKYGKDHAAKRVKYYKEANYPHTKTKLSYIERSDLSAIKLS